MSTPPTEKTPLELEAERLHQKNLELAQKYVEARDVDALFALYKKAVLHNASLLQSIMLFADKEMITLLRNQDRPTSDASNIKEIALEAISLAKAVIAGKKAE